MDEIQRCRCSTCGKPASFEAHVGAFVHDDEQGTHNVTRRVRFDAGPSWEACDTGRRWNGWAIPAVTPEVQEQIAAFCATANGPTEARADAELAAEIRALPVEDGLVEIDLGLTFSWVDEWSSDDEEPAHCECDNTHDQNDTVCRWCWAHGRRRPGDPNVE